MVLRIKLISDVHLEVNDPQNLSVKPLDKDENDTTVCVLAGDIGNLTVPGYRDFLLDTRSKYNYVILVAGNHEMYGFDITDMHRCLSEMCKDTGCIYLNRSSVMIDGTEFIGATLWVNINDNMAAEAKQHFREFQCTTINQRPMNVTEYNKMHAADLEYIKSKISTEVIVVTHYPFSLRMCGIQDKKTRFYANDLEYLAEGFLAVLSGHSHYSHNIDNMFSNQVGYEGQFTFFNEDFELII